MDWFHGLAMIGGLGLFLFGMQVMGEGLRGASGGKLAQLLQALTARPVRGVLLGVGATALIQSSSAVTVMVVEFVNSRIMNLTQAARMIMGANIGTTVTSWILCLSGLEGENGWISFWKPSSFILIFAAAGTLLILLAGNERKKDIGTILAGFGALMFGMETMSEAVRPLADTPEFARILTAFSNPLLGLLAGTVLTAVIQSSSASVGILQALCMTGTVSYGVAIPIIMGQNIGTCVTALLSAVGANKNGKRAAMVHLYFNIIGTSVFMIVFYSVDLLMRFSFLSHAASAVGIALVHTLFNLFAAVLLLPFSNSLVRLVSVTFPDDMEREPCR